MPGTKSQHLQISTEPSVITLIYVTIATNLLSLQASMVDPVEGLPDGWCRDVVVHGDRLQEGQLRLGCGH